MGGLKKIPAEGGSGGKRGHSSMEHWAKTGEIKDAARKVRRQADKQTVRQGEENAVTETVTKYRPVGPEELRLIEESGFRRFPPRLPEQPIFYPVCNERYAREIAEKWNVKESGSGYVTKFAVEASVVARYDRQVVGARHHEELWVPAEELDAFNDAIIGTIEVIQAFGGGTVDGSAKP